MRLAVLATLLSVASVHGATRTIKIAQFGDYSGPLFTFGPNTNGVVQAAAQYINDAGGVSLPNGDTGLFEVTPFDSQCNSAKAIGIVKRLVTTDFIAGIGPTCSGAAKPLFQNLQANASDPDLTHKDACVARAAAYDAAFDEAAAAAYTDAWDAAYTAAWDAAWESDADCPSEITYCANSTAASADEAGTCTSGLPSGEGDGEAAEDDDAADACVQTDCEKAAEDAANAAATAAAEAAQLLAEETTAAEAGDAAAAAVVCMQFPVFTDTAITPGIASLSDWAFRQVPNEYDMYDALFSWINITYPDLRTVFGGAELSNAHSFLTWMYVMRRKAIENGFDVQQLNVCDAASGEPTADVISRYGWPAPCIPDTGEAQYCDGSPSAGGDVGGTDAGQDACGSRNVHCGYTWFKYQDDFSLPASHFRQMNPDIAVLAAHPFTTCGMLKEFARQRYAPKLLVGLTSSTNLATLRGCSIQAEGMVIPTSYAAVNDQAAFVSDAAGAFGGETDLHSAAAWEILHILKLVIESEGVEAGGFDTVHEDRRKIRDGLAALAGTTLNGDGSEPDLGLLGAAERQADGETKKPFLFVQAKQGDWEVVFPEDGGLLYGPEDVLNYV